MHYLRTHQMLQCVCNVHPPVVHALVHVCHALSRVVFLRAVWFVYVWVGISCCVISRFVSAFTLCFEPCFACLEFSKLFRTATCETNGVVWSLFPVLFCCLISQTSQTFVLVCLRISTNTNTMHWTQIEWKTCKCCGGHFGSKLNGSDVLPPLFPPCTCPVLTLL